MNGIELIQIIILAVSYCLFSNEFFLFTAEINKKKISFWIRFACFFCVYLWFLIASYLELPLVVNWFVFLVILGLEVRLVFSFDFPVSCGLSLFCIIMGLAVNVFFRSLTSILLKMPLNVFDHTTSFLKTYPIFLGFIAMVFLLHLLRRLCFPTKLRQMLQCKKSLIFYIWTEVFIYLFLMVQLLTYSQTGNEAGIKAWGIKSALFSIVVLFITVIYAFRVASLQYYMDKQHENRSRLIREKQDVNKLWELAYTDTLTGFHNRQLLMKRLKESARYGSSITLAFIDVNGLKTANDQYGHVKGDHYLADVSKILSQVTDGLSVDLYRYGGDEFVMISSQLEEGEVLALLARANQLLKNVPASFPRSISYGVVRGNGPDYQNLLAKADDIMYQHKQKHYGHMTRS